MKRFNPIAVGTLALAMFISVVAVRHIRADAVEAMAFCFGERDDEGELDCSDGACPDDQKCLYQHVTIFGIFLEWCGCRVRLDTVVDTTTAD